MTPPAGTGMQLSALVERLDAVITRLEKLDERLETSEAQRSQFRADYERNHAVLEAKAQAAHFRIDKIDIDLQKMSDLVKCLEKTISPIVTTNTVLRWVGAAIGLSIIGLIWSIITGQVTLVFP